MHLSDYMQLKGLRDQDVADKTGLNRSSISRLRRRLVRPDWNTITALKKMSRGEITADDFSELGKS